jgi:RecA-family ATPase
MTKPTPDANDIAREFGEDELRRRGDEAWQRSRRADGPDPGNNPEENSSRLHFTPVSAWADKPIPERQWGVAGRIPHANVTLFSGDGGAGKTILVQQLLVAAALRREWLGVVPSAGPCIGVFCEESDDELHRRFDRIAGHYGAGLGDLHDLHIKSLAGQDAVLAMPDRDGIVQPTGLFWGLLTEARNLRPAFLTLDNSADVYAGSEIDRSQVRQFIGLLRRLAIEVNTCVLLTAHPSLSGMASGSGFSGSTAWNASARSRLYLRKPKPEGDDAGDPDERVLEVLKSNYGPAGETISLRWKDGVFVPNGAVHWLDRRAADHVADDLFLKLLRQFQAQGRNVSATKNAPTYAPAAFADDPEAKAKGIRKPALADAMNRLFSANRIEVQTYGKPSRVASRIVAKGSS